MLHPIFNEVADRIFLHDPILRKLVERIQREEDNKDDESAKNKEIPKRD